MAKAKSAYNEAAAIVKTLSDEMNTLKDQLLESKETFTKTNGLKSLVAKFERSWEKDKAAKAKKAKKVKKVAAPAKRKTKASKKVASVVTENPEVEMVEAE